jgi:hypothetical protein
MSDIPQLAAAIESRLADIAAEIVALDAAKAALAAPRTGGHAPAITADATATGSRRRASRRRLTPSPGTRELATRGGEPDPVDAAQGVGSTVTAKRSARTGARTVTRPRRGVGVRAETLERLLANASAGLSANAIAEQAGAGYSRTLRLLRELEIAGQVRRSGSRRSPVWRLVTDDERIAERAAELERRRSTPNRRRGRAGAS